MWHFFLKWAIGSAIFWLLMLGQAVLGSPSEVQFRPEELIREFQIKNPNDGIELLTLNSQINNAIIEMFYELATNGCQRPFFSVRSKIGDPKTIRLVVYCLKWEENFA